MRIKSWHMSVRTHREMVPRSVIGMQQDPAMLEQLTKNITRMGMSNATLNYLRVCIRDSSMAIIQFGLTERWPSVTSVDWSSLRSYRFGLIFNIKKKDVIVLPEETIADCKVCLGAKSLEPLGDVSCLARKYTGYPGYEGPPSFRARKRFHRGMRPRILSVYRLGLKSRRLLLRSRESPRPLLDLRTRCSKNARKTGP